MKTLTVLRHAKSSWEQAGVEDIERPLNDRGRKAARRVGIEMTDREMRFDLCLASPAARVRETLAELSQGFAGLPEPRFEPSIYLAGPDALLDLLHALPDEAASVLLVGHNPGLEELVLGLTHADAGHLRDRVAAKFPTGALAAIELPADHWREVTAGSGTIVQLILPRELD